MRTEQYEFERALYKALTIAERDVSIHRAVPHLRTSFKKIVAWQRLSGFDNSPLKFLKRLTFDELNPVKFIAALGAEPRPKSRKTPVWIEEFIKNEYRSVGIDYKKLHSLEIYLERGIISPFRAQLHSHVDNLYNQVSKSRFFTNDSEMISIVDIAISSQLIRFENLVRRAVVLEINVLRLRKSLQGESPSQRYASFIKLCESRTYRISFHKKYPVLARLANTRLKHWCDNTIELISRLDRDWEEVCSAFGMELNDKIISISSGGDTHNSGRAVTTVILTSGKSIVYKPRSVSLENNFQELLRYFNFEFSSLNLKTMKVVEKDNYGWIEFIEPEQTCDQEQLEKYFLQLGALTAITHPMHGVDFFFENVIASKQGPVLIDLETLFHQSLEIESAKNARENTQLILQDSVLGMGILPQPQQGANTGDIFDISVIGARRNQQAPYNVTGLVNLDRDDIRIKQIPGWIPSIHSSPTDDEINISARSYFLKGYDLITSFIIDNKNDFISKSGPLASFSDSTRRLIVRNTKTYGGLQADESHPDLLRDQSDRQWHWDNLWSELKSRPILDRFVYSEIDQLMKGDIPYFYGSVNQKHVTASDKKRINLDDLVKYNPLQSVKNNIHMLNIADVEKQRWYIGTSLGLTGISGLTTPKLGIKKSYEENLLEVGNFVLSKLVYFGEESWFVAMKNPTPDIINNQSVSFSPAKHGLYDGVAGVAYFLAILDRKSSEDKYKRAAESLIKSLIRDRKGLKKLDNSGFTGKASIVYVLDKLIKIWGGEKEISEVISMLVTQIRVEIEGEDNLDVLSGVAGIALALLPYVISSGNKDGVEILKISMRKICSAHKLLITSDEPFTGLSYLRGFSHGLSGIALALYRLSKYFNDTSVFIQSKELITREIELVGTSQWTDSHQYKAEPLAAWCHGAPGIVLALTNMPKLLEEPVIEKYFNSAIDISFNSGFYESCCLCHGSLGNIDILKTAQSNNIQSEKIKIQTNNLIEKIFIHGFASFGNDQTLGLSLMTGISGLGYGLFRLTDPAAVPSILSLE